MKTEEEFKTYYDTVLLGKANLLEGLRVKTKKDLTAFYIFCSIVLICSLGVVAYILMHLDQLTGGTMHNSSYGFGYRQARSKYSGVGTMIGAIAFLNIGLFMYSWNIKRGYRLSFRKNIVLPMLDFYNQGLKYMPEKELPYKAVAVSSLFNDMGDYSARDYMEGKVNKTFVQMAVLELSRSIDSAEDAFKGLLMITPLNAAPLKDKVIIYSWKHESLYVDMPFKDTMKLEPLQYGSDAFNKEFIVFATDKNLLPALITPALMDWMLKLKEKAGARVCFSFTRNSMFMGLQSKSIFEPAIKKPMQPDDVFNWARNFHIALQAMVDFETAKPRAVRA